MQVERSFQFEIGDFGQRSITGSKDSGERVSNAWIIYLRDRDNLAKAELIPDKLTSLSKEVRKDLPLVCALR